MSGKSEAVTSRAFRPEARADDELQFMVTVLDIQDAAPSIRRLRDWALDAAEPHPGELVVDVGSGTGTMTRELTMRSRPRCWPPS